MTVFYVPYSFDSGSSSAVQQGALLPRQDPPVGDRLRAGWLNGFLGEAPFDSGTTSAFSETAHLNDSGTKIVIHLDDSGTNLTRA